jgi:predicted AAA+ superfamily ATPase
LAQFPKGAVLDEVQRVPELLSWIQVRVDEHKTAGEFILTGSHQFELSRHISQSLAGRSALLKLLPLSVAELCDAGLPSGVDHLLFAGGYPRIHADHLDPAVMLGDYFATYCFFTSPVVCQCRKTIDKVTKTLFLRCRFGFLADRNNAGFTSASSSLARIAV